MKQINNNQYAIKNSWYSIESARTSLPPYHTGKGLIRYTIDPESLVNHLQIAIGSVQAGNRSKRLQRDIIETLDSLLRIEHITPEEHKQLYMQYADYPTRVYKSKKK